MSRTASIALMTTALLVSGCTKQIVVSKDDRLATVVDATAPRTTEKSSHRHGLRLTVRDPRTGAEDRISLPNGSCPAWRERAGIGMRITVRYVTTRPEESQTLTSHPTSEGLRDRIC